MDNPVGFHNDHPLYRDLSSAQRFPKRLNNQGLKNKPLVSAFVTRSILSSRKL